MITGGDQQGNPTNINVIGGPIPGVQPNIVIQGGGIFANAYARHMEITNNLIVGNGGAYAGAIRVGTPDVPAPLTDIQNDDIRITYNRVIANGGTNLAGAIGLFAGAAGYDVSYNDICGNYSAEYGGGISHFGLSPDSSIHHNRILYNRSYDEGGGVMIAGELPADPDILSPGAGAVNVYNNIIQGNLANDDGGGLRFLMAGQGALSTCTTTYHEQCVDPRGRRRVDLRRAGRPVLQQHDHEEHHDGHRHDVERAAGAGRPLHRPQQ